MRTPNDDKTKSEIKDFYTRLQLLLDQREMKWSDLALLIGLNPKTISSMKSQLVNPSFTTVKKIAEALDVSLDEFINNENKSEELYELYWSIPRYIENQDIQSITCKQMMAITYATGALTPDHEESRMELTKKQIADKISELKNK